MLFGKRKTNEQLKEEYERLNVQSKAAEVRSGLIKGIDKQRAKVKQMKYESSNLGRAVKKFKGPTREGLQKRAAGTKSYLERVSNNYMAQQAKAGPTQGMAEYGKKSDKDKKKSYDLGFM